jgi:hypothetical protein
MNPAPSLHHVVLCVEPDNQDAAADVWRTLGFEFVEILLADVLLRVLLDWTRGIEIISPTTSDATSTNDSGWATSCSRSFSFENDARRKIPRGSAMSDTTA